MNGAIELHYPEPKDTQLVEVGPGCFVQLASEAGCYWVEIDGEDGDTLTGVVHKELPTLGCRIKADPPERVTFKRNQVAYLGCDRYCVC